MKLKSIFTLASIFVIFASINVFAQMGGNPQERLKKTLDDYKTRLKLTDFQLAKVDTILTAQMGEMTKLRENAGDDRQAMMASFMELREKTNQSIEALLNDEQKIEWKKILEEAAQRRQGMGRG